MVILEFKNVSAAYGREEILHNISFQMEKGHFLGIIGPNGSGKSTLLKTAVRILRHSKGQVLFKNIDTRNISARELAKSVSFLPSDIEIAYPYTVKELLLMARYPFSSEFRSPGREDIEIIISVAKQMELSQFLDRTIYQMSEGEKQRVLLAQCLVQEPELIILDEPTSHLDIGFQFAFLDLLKNLQIKSGLSVMAVLHDLNLASQYSERILLLKNGSVAKFGAVQDVIRYEIIEDVYHTNVLVYPHPISGKPYVFGIPESWKNLTKKQNSN
ncbi:MAG: ABC transporter ATP-binding protein [Candidatus Omnitrophica bacterium]|nr:ABC transporter ATP-binding protein [Candidatus Omnitrophota bacterium]MCM8789169.1 ABC transporter ATP-binding protein [Candidatus Omnitrophota bacterium]